MDDPEKADLVRRLNTVHGHVSGITRMVTEDAYCIDVLHQIQAVQSALDRVSDLVLERHLASCVVTAVRGEDAEEREQVLREVAGVFRARRRV